MKRRSFEEIKDMCLKHPEKDKFRTVYAFYNLGFTEGSYENDGLSPKKNKPHNFSCECGWLHKGVYPGFKCFKCNAEFQPVD